jgi:sugar transferase (PEP-CTERM system associated)
MIRLFSHWLPSGAIVQALLDALLLVLSVAVATLWLSSGNLDSLTEIAPDAVLFATAMVLLNAALGLYARGSNRTLAATAAQLVFALGLAVPVAYVIFRVLPPGLPWGPPLQYAVPLAFVALVIIRALVSRSWASSVLVRRALVIGTGEEAAAVRDSFRQLGPEFKLIGFLQTKKADVNPKIENDRILVAADGLLATARKHRIDDLIIAVQERRGGVLPLRELLDCRLAGVRVLDRSSFYERALGQIRIDSLRASWLIFGEGFRQGLWRRSVKRVFDVTASTVLLLLAAPMMLVTTLLLILETGFPIFYRQERVGLNGNTFDLIKFRSMRTDAEKDGQPRWAVAADSRVTRVGRVIRKLRIDELPQLVNVLKGDMSLVGPRPERPYFVTLLTSDIPYYAVRHSVKPGITGWAQVNYQYGSSVDDSLQKLQYDLYYVKNNSLFLDVVILVETVHVVLTGQGAQ